MGEPCCLKMGAGMYGLLLSFNKVFGDITFKSLDRFIGEMTEKKIAENYLGVVLELAILFCGHFYEGW